MCLEKSSGVISDYGRVEKFVCLVAFGSALGPIGLLAGPLAHERTVIMIDKFRRDNCLEKARDLSSLTLSIISGVGLAVYAFQQLYSKPEAELKDFALTAYAVSAAAGVITGGLTNQAVAAVFNRCCR